MKKTIVFPKNHGVTGWKHIVKKERPDRVIFTGNYFDSSNLMNEELVDNFLDIIKYANESKKVVLLIGRHDLQYLDTRLKIPGFREDGAQMFHEVIDANLHLFVQEYVEDDLIYRQDSIVSDIDSSLIQLIGGYYYINGVPKLLLEADGKPLIYQNQPQRPMEYNIVNGFKVGIYSGYMSNTLQSVLDAQRSVFDTFNIKLNQVLWTKSYLLGQFLNHIVDTEDVDFFVFFDIDSIPLKPNILEILIKMAGKNKIVGSEQVSVHVKGYEDHVFAAPSCFCISNELYNRMGRTRFDFTDRGDNTQELTHAAQEQGIDVIFLRYSHCEKPNYYWKLPNGKTYGYGSTYEDMVYHNFESRFSKVDYFIDKCKEIVEKYSK